MKLFKKIVLFQVWAQTHFFLIIIILKFICCWVYIYFLKFHTVQFVYYFYFQWNWLEKTISKIQRHLQVFTGILEERSRWRHKQPEKHEAVFSVIISTLISIAHVPWAKVEDHDKEVL